MATVDGKVRLMIQLENMFSIKGRLWAKLSSEGFEYPHLVAEIQPGEDIEVYEGYGHYNCLSAQHKMIMDSTTVV